MREGSAVLGSGEHTTADRVVYHVDADCFYAACERLKEPSLEGEPVVVGMGYDEDDQTGAVATASYEAREHGVESAQPISRAVERLPPASRVDADHDGPTAHYRPVDMEYYEAVAADVKEILHGVADTVREVSVDEAYLDVTETVVWDDAEAVADDLKRGIAERVGVTVSIGVAPTMSAAKIASDHDKPDGLVVVPPGDVRDFLAPLDVEDVHGVGPVTADALRDLGIATAGDLADADPGTLRDRFGDRGVTIRNHARGDDRREVTPREPAKSLLRASAIDEPTDDVTALRERLEGLARAVAEKARSRGAMYRTIGIVVVTPPFDRNTRERSLSGPVDDPAIVLDVATELFGEFHGETVRKLGVRVSNLRYPDHDQAALGSYTDDEDGDGELEHRGTRTTASGGDDGGQAGLDEFG
jgi:DNA polymerase IV (DinB-like DNA polymerase)